MFKKNSSNKFIDVLKIENINKMPLKKKIILKRILVFTVSIIALILILFFARFADQRVEFRDKGLESAIRNALDNKYSPISKNDLLSIAELDASGREIKSLDGIEDLHNLVSLNLEGNHIKDLSPLKNLKNLTELNLRSNSITNLYKINFKSIVTLPLTILNLSNNVLKLDSGLLIGLSDISLVSQFNKLEELDLEGNRIKDITALGNIHTLKVLDLRENYISDISALSGLTELEYLNIHSNENIESIKPIANLTGLQTLIMRNVYAGEDAGSLASLANLKRLNMANCSISDISFIALLINAGALQDDTLTGKKASIDITDNPILTSHINSLESIRPYWHDISLRAPFILPLAVSILNPPEFSHKGGFYNEGFLLELSISEPGAQIFYTLDGSEPTRLSNLYTSPIQIDSRKGEPNIFSNIRTSPSFKIPDEEIFKATVIRARAFTDDKSVSSIVTHTYFIDETNEGDTNKYSLPVISITTDSGNLFDYNYGIFVPGIYSENKDSKSAGNYFQRGIEWERPAHIEFFEPDGRLGFSQNAGIRVHGESTRYLPIKSMHILASDLYDEKDMFYYPIFPGLLKAGNNEPVMQFKSFILRNSGNDYFSTYFRDGMLQALVSHLDFETQAYRPSIVFINGEYWGIYNIRENYCEYYINTHYGVDMDKVVILEDRDSKVEVGLAEDRNDFFEMVKFIQESVDSGTINDPGMYEYINTLIDLQSFVDYFAAEIFFLNNDWPQNNISFWRARTRAYEANAEYGSDGRWRYVMFDTDLSYGLWDQSADHNFIGHAADNNKLFELLLENDEFKYQFINTMADLTNSIFRAEWTTKKIIEAQSLLEPEMPEHLKRWDFMDVSVGQWNENVQKMIQFAKERPASQIQHIIEFFSLYGTTEINLITDLQKGYIRINSLELKEGTPGIESPANWKGNYFKKVPVQITAVPYPGYEFSGWEETGNNSPSIIISPEENVILTAIFIDSSKTY